MTVQAGPRSVTNGLVLSIDLANMSGNSSSLISTNFIQNGAFFNGTNPPQESGSNPTNTIVLLNNPGNSPYVLRQNGNNAEYQLNLTTEMISATEYVMSGWYAKSSDYNSTDTMFHARAFSTSGTHVSTGVGLGSLAYSTVIDGITWEYRYQTITTPADYNNAFNWYLGYGANNTTGFRYYTNLKVERGSYPSLLDLSNNGNNGRPINGMSYSSSNAGSIVFDGTNDYVIGPSISSQFTADMTAEFWIRIAATPSDWVRILGTGEPGNRTFGLWCGTGRAFLWQRLGATDPAIYATGSPVALSTWNHVVATTSGSSHVLYLNGVQIGSATAAGPWPASNQPITIGYGMIHTYLNGNISNAKLYNRGLTAAEVLTNFNALRGRYGI